MIDLQTLKNLWVELEDIPIDNNDCIECDFHVWPKGTDRLTIWHWFDEELPNGLAKWVMM